MKLCSQINDERIKKYHKFIILENQYFELSNLGKAEWKNHPHFNSDVSDIEHFSRIIHTVNQSSIYGTVSNRREQFVWQRKQKEVRKDEIFNSKYVD